MIFLLGLGFQQLQAQDTYSLSGKVTDSLGAGLYPATVQVIGEKDTANTLTKEDGSFSLKNLRIRKIRLLVTMKGYRPVDRSIAIADKRQSVQLGTLVLPADYGELDPVTVTRVRPMTIAGDTVSYNTAAFPVRDGSEVEDILKRLPGVEVDINGNVIVQGKIVSKVLVNGKEFFGGDVLLAIQNLPADVVDKLQIIDDYGDKARLTGVKSGESAKVLNIVMKTDKRNGEFGQAEVGIGDYEKYTGDVFANEFKADRQISLHSIISNNNPAGNNPIHSEAINYADRWNSHWTGSINYNNGGQESHTNNSSIQDNYYSGEQLQQTVASQNYTENNNNSIRTTIIYKPDNYATLRLNSSADLHTAKNQSTGSFNDLEIDSGFTKSTAGSNLTSSQSAGQTIKSNIYYEHVSQVSHNRFSLQLDISYSNTKQLGNNLSNAIAIIDTISTSSVIHYIITNVSPQLNANFNSTYFLPLSATSFLELGYHGISSRSQTNLLTQQPGAGINTPITIDSLSQQQVFSTFTQIFNVGFSGHLRCLDLTADLDGQPGKMVGSTSEKGNTISYDYFKFLPKIDIAWPIDNVRKINFNYTSQPTLPSLDQLTPFTNVTNPQYPVTGNPNLKPSTTNAFSLHYEQTVKRATQFYGFGVSLGFNSTINSIISNFSQPKDNSQVIQQINFVNAGTTTSIHADYHITFPSLFDKQLRITSNGTYSINKSPTINNDLLYNCQNLILSQSIHLQFLISDIIETNFNAKYSVTHSIYPGSDSLENLFKTASLSLTTRHILFKQWIVNYELSQPYTSKGKGLQQDPCNISFFVQRQFLPHNKATISFNLYNLLNSAASITQSSSTTGITQTKAQYIGRYYCFTFQLKLNHFKK